MLSEREEEALRQIIRENPPPLAKGPTPLRAVPEVSADSETERFFRSLDSKKLETFDLNDDPYLKSILKRAGFPEMSPGEAYALGLTRQFIIDNRDSLEKINAAIAAARAADAAQGIVEPKGSLTFATDAPAVRTLGQRVIQVGKKIIGEVF